MSLLACVALSLACAGIAGLVAYAGSQRTKEIGIRMALGAPPRQVVAIIILREFATPVLAGVLAGVGVATLLSRVCGRRSTASAISIRSRTWRPSSYSP